MMKSEIGRTWGSDVGVQNIRAFGEQGNDRLHAQLLAMARYLAEETQVLINL